MLVPAGVSYSHCFCRVNVTSFSEEDDELSTGQFLILITSKMDRIMSKLVMGYRTPTLDVTVILTAVSWPAEPVDQLLDTKTKKKTSNFAFPALHCSDSLNIKVP